MKFDYEGFYEEAPVGYFTSNSLGIIIHANRFFLSLVEENSEDVINKQGLQHFLPIGGKIYFQTHYFPLLQMDGKVKEVNFEILRKDKSRIPVLVNTYKSEQSYGEPIYHSVVFGISQRSLFEKELIAERKNAEALTEELKKTNEKIVAQAETIKKQNASLDRLNAVKDKFFNIVAHDIKAPLNNLYSFVYLLQSEVDDLDKEDFKAMSEKIGKSISETIDMADNLLSWAQSQMKDYGVTATTFALQEVIENIVQSQLPVAEKKGIQISYSFDDKIKVKVDKNQLYFIVGNLLSNAVKFTSQGGNIDIQCSLDEEKIRITVADNGVGMSEEYMKAIFSDERKTTKIGTAGEKGNGIGLVLVKEFVTMNNGTIEVSSEQDKGTTFTVTLKSAT